MGLDAVEIVMAVEETFSIKITDADTQFLETPRQLIDYIFKCVSARNDISACLSQQAFHRVRSSAIAATSLPRNVIKLNTRLLEAFPKSSRKAQWQAFREHIGILSLPQLSYGRGWLLSPTTFRDIVTTVMYDRIKDLPTTEGWTYHEIREVTRLLISEQLAVYDFSDDAHFVHDLGCD